MKLLEKSTINTAVQTERKAVIDSGIFLAKKVDKLRSELLSLEEQRKNFIEGSRIELEKVLGGLKKEIKDLNSEISDQRKVLAKLREPLDEEWRKLRITKQNVDEAQEKVDDFLGHLTTERQIVAEKDKKADFYLELALKQKNESDKLLETATTKHTESVLVLEKARKLKDSSDAEFYNTEIRLSEWEKRLEKREKDFKKEVQAFNKEKKALEIKKSRWKT